MLSKIKQRRCHACGERTTTYLKYGQIHYRWNINRGVKPEQVLCDKCNWYYILGPKHNSMVQHSKFSYARLHVYIRKIKPQPECCENCGEKVEKMDLHSLTKPDYTENVEDWIYLCRTCHNTIDPRRLTI